MIIGGVNVGRKLTDGVFADKVADGRYVIRKLGEVGGTPYAKRVGEVFGSGATFVACRMKGEKVGVAKSLLGAARLLCL